tara:strand:+ start:29895 stop:30254 length:360 start_codon:yes stop_codon:yes gene_type:complete
MIFINLIGIILIAFIIWWFWLYKPKDSKAVKVTKQDTIVVQNGIYQPSIIKIKADQSSTLTFLRKDANPCSRTLLFPDLEISMELPIDKIQTVDLPALKAGEYPFQCSMKMYSGLLIVE